MAHDFDSLRALPIGDLVAAARGARVENASGLRRQDLVATILREQSPGVSDGEGILEILPDGFGFLRAPSAGFAAGGDDIYVSPSQIRRFHLRTGDLVRGQVRAPKESERYFALIKLERINDLEPELAREKILFDNLSPIWPRRWLRVGRPDSPVGRCIDLFAPLCRGQRSLLLCPPRAGRSTVLSEITRGIAENHPEIVIFLVLLGERPEDLSEATKASPAIVLASTAEEPESRHVQVADIAIERARRLVELGKDVVVLVDSLSRLGRASQGNTPPSGRSLPGGLDPAAFARVRTFLGSARAVAEGGSLTVVAATLTGGAFESAVIEELAGMENHRLLLAPPGSTPGLPLDISASASEREPETWGPRLAEARIALRAAAERGELLPLLSAFPDDKTLLDALLLDAFLLDVGSETGK